MIQWLRNEALLLLNGGGAVLEVAREVSRILRDRNLDGAVIGGIAVVLHGYVRTTIDVDVFTDAPLDLVADALREAGFTFHRARREFRKGVVPIHLVTVDQTRMVPSKSVDIEQVRTVSLPDLINMKLASGLGDPLRAIDLADVIGLIRAKKLTPAFAAKLAKPVRLEFRKLARAIARNR